MDSGHMQNHETIRPTGDLSETDAGVFREELRRAVEQGKTHLTIDLDQVGEIGALGLATLLSCHNTLQGLGGSLTVCTDRPEFKQMFHLFRLDRCFAVTAPEGGIEPTAGAENVVRS